MRGRWAAGIVPRNFAWIVADHLAVCERPGGASPNHRKVRRQEEILWLKAQGFTEVVSILGSSHNLHAYDDLEMPWSQVSVPIGADPATALPDLYMHLAKGLAEGNRMVVHGEELSDFIVGAMAGFLLWSGMLSSEPQAIAVVERLVGRKMGTHGREVVAAVPRMDPPPRTARITPQET